MRLINAIDYAKELKAEMEWPGRHPEFISAIECAMADLGDMPTIEAEPVHHAKWRVETDEEMPNPMFKLVVCCGCNEKANNTYNYCPNCGAKMDLEA